MPEGGWKNNRPDTFDLVCPPMDLSRRFAVSKIRAMNTYYSPLPANPQAYTEMVRKFDPNREILLGTSGMTLAA